MIYEGRDSVVLAMLESRGLLTRFKKAMLEDNKRNKDTVLINICVEIQELWIARQFTAPGDSGFSLVRVKIQSLANRKIDIALRQMITGDTKTPGHLLPPLAKLIKINEMRYLEGPPLDRN